MIALMSDNGWAIGGKTSMINLAREIHCVTILMDNTMFINENVERGWY